MTSKTRIKRAAVAASVPQTTDDCARDIGALGATQRDLDRLAAEMNDQIQAITVAYQPKAEALKGRISNLQTGIQHFCEAHRGELTRDGKVKTANFLTGEVQWRQRPPSVSVRGADTVLETLRRLSLERFIRSKDEPNKEAMLNEPDAVRGVAGINIISGVEDFVITPFEAEVEAMA